MKKIAWIGLMLVLGVILLALRAPDNEKATEGPGGQFRVIAGNLPPAIAADKVSAEVFQTTELLAAADRMRPLIRELIRIGPDAMPMG